MYTIDLNGYFRAMNNVGLESLGATKDEVIEATYQNGLQEKAWK